MSRFDGRVAIVTGGAQGIGAATSRLLAAQGAAVAVVDLTPDRSQPVADAIVAEGGRAIAIGADVSDEQAVGAMVETAVAELGGLHILINNAGITRDDLLFKMSKDSWDAVIAINLTSMFLCCQAATKHMVAQRYGRIVSLSSRSALGNRGQVNYAAAKAGVQGLTATLAIELGPLQHRRQRRRSRIHRDRDDRRHSTSGRLRSRGVPQARRRADAAAPRRSTGGGRRGDRVPGQRRGVLRVWADAVHQRRRPLAGLPTRRDRPMPGRRANTSEGNRSGSVLQRRGIADPRHRTGVHSQRGDAARAGSACDAPGITSPGWKSRELRELQQKAKAIGFWGLSTPEEYGGMNLSAVLQSLICHRDRAHLRAVPVRR